MFAWLLPLAAFAADLPPEICADGRPCTLVKRHPAGASTKGAAMQVVQVDHGPPLERVKEHPSLMRRPLIETGDQLYLGWTADVKSALGVA